MSQNNSDFTLYRTEGHIARILDVQFDDSLLNFCKGHRMTPSDKTAIEGFLDKLQSTLRGRAMAVNMFESGSLVSPESLNAFLLDCAKTSVSFPANDAVKVIEDVACGYGDGKQSYLRQCKQALSAAGDKEQLSNTMNTVSFHSFLLDEKYKDGSVGILPVVLPKIPDNSPSGLRDYRTRLSEVTADPAWSKPAATIGIPLPAPSNCWITSDQFGDEPNAPDYPDDSATEARDKLGLIDNGEGKFLLRLSFLATSLAKIPNNELARPVFSDLGNSRFRVHQSSNRAKIFAQQGWGATTHLGKLGDSKYSDLTGVCERVSSALPIIALERLTVELLGRVTRDRGIETHDDDEAYANELQAGRSEAAIKNNLLSLLS